MPKKHPPKATPIQLPTYESQPLRPYELLRVTAEELRKIVIGVHPSKWQSHIHQRFGVELTNGLELEKLVPKEYIPTNCRNSDISQTPETGNSRRIDNIAAQRLSNGLSPPDSETFASQIAELSCEYEDALRILAREKPRVGSTLAKLTHLRRFWISMDVIVRYWDTSRDEYRPELAEVTKRISDHTEARKLDPVMLSTQRDSSTQRGGDRAFQAIKYPSLHQRSSLEAQTQSEKQESDYFGWRNATGRDMPNTHRQELIANFIEPIVRAMGCHYEPGSLRSELPFDPKRFVQVVDGRIRIPISGLIYRIPAELKVARDGWNEGPLIAVSARSSINFSPVDMESSESMQTSKQFVKDGKPDGTAKDRKVNGISQAQGFDFTDELPPRFVKWQNTDIIDASKEIGALLMLAQFRFRNARSEDEVIVGKNKWWAENPRCGGVVSDEPSHEVKKFGQDYTDNSQKWPREPFLSDSMISTDEISPNECGTNSTSSTSLEKFREKDPENDFMAKRQRLSEGSKEDYDPSRRERDSDRKKLLAISRKPLPVWDSKTHFCSIGRGPNQDFDHVYLISCVFHHVSIVCMRIHPSMLAFLSSKAEKSTVCVEDVMQLEHFGLYMRRSRWYDLLVPQDRVDAFCAIWAVVRYMMRDTTDEGIGANDFAEELSRSGKIASQGQPN